MIPRGHSKIWYVGLKCFLCCCQDVLDKLMTHFHFVEPWDWWPLLLLPLWSCLGQLFLFLLLLLSCFLSHKLSNLDCWHSSTFKYLVSLISLMKLSHSLNNSGPRIEANFWLYMYLSCSYQSKVLLMFLTFIQ